MTASRGSRRRRGGRPVRRGPGLPGRRRRPRHAPAGAYGADTGIQDAADLAWKLANVLRGRAGPALLDTYDAERRPIARLTVDQAPATGREWFGAELPPQAGAVELLRPSASPAPARC
ncbi:2-polyprenyl-6-methoxyphenol hydroxylase-like FAD-dependent oxidoreductase [Thermocatellispora tengchongensis]|uniref:2-polyprenyl-6-methoxyphenol hydroxylase-like FAD-dependent oxidoreductase n=1 Tax=Thermocatellispora tengchongensis TaxID=1073253 RepID=A0A840PMP5_9ACTN|nr:2-polyprenyl-6-methoxyphenol hydroxylase-like FAD-dependent oxidoreductase [Thermocatellispora tengchongensis]